MSSTPLSELTVTDWTGAEADAFTAKEWPPHDAHLQIVWDSRDVTLVGRVGNDVVGVARGVIVGGLGELKWLLVKKERARAGIGSQLLAAFEQRCRALGCHKLRLETGDYQARPFYERHGFEVAARLTNDRFGRDWFVMEKRLLETTPRS